MCKGTDGNFSSAGCIAVKGLPYLPIDKKALGAKEIIAADLFDDKLSLASQMGATTTLNVKNVDLGSEIMKITSGNGIERICEASGHAPTLNASFKWLRKGGKMGIVGLPKDTVKFDNPLTG